MGLESATYISELNEAWPLGSDGKNTLDNHARLTKAAIKTTFPNVTGAVTPTHTELNYVDGVTSAIQTQIDTKAPIASPTFTGVPAAPTAAAATNTTQLATTAHVFAERTNTATLTNKTLTAPVINSPTGLVKADVGLGSVDDTSDASKPVSTATQTALDLKAALASPTFTGTPAAPTATAGTSTTQLATTAFVQAAAFTAALPAQAGSSGKFVTTDGSNASWSLVPLATGVSGTLPVANGGTGAVTLTGLVKGNGTGAFTAAAAGTDYQAVLVSGTNIKTINSTSLLGSGDLVVGGVGDHCITVHTGNGHGSTNTKIRRFTTTLTSVGTAITYADSAANGASFTINEAGIYAIQTQDFGGSGVNIGISKNSSQLTTGVELIAIADRLALVQIAAASRQVIATAVVKLAVSDVIRAHTDSFPTGSTDIVFFSIRKIGT